MFRCIDIADSPLRTGSDALFTAIAAISISDYCMPVKWQVDLAQGLIRAGADAFPAGPALPCVQIDIFCAVVFSSAATA
jgi:hypothetical protein